MCAGRADGEFDGQAKLGDGGWRKRQVSLDVRVVLANHGNLRTRIETQFDSKRVCVESELPQENLT